jgi:methylated-DNA-[protein]-cysteine S-methyltransferase
MNREAPVDPMEHPILHQTRRWLDAYFRGEEPAVDLPLHLEGTDFQRRVWKILLTIPYGQTMSYGEIASIITAGRSQTNAVSGADRSTMSARTAKPRMSAQAVGGAVGHNPISLIIPCHRVIGADGSLTGYAGGLERKQAMLELEQTGV